MSLVVSVLPVNTDGTHTHRQTRSQHDSHSALRLKMLRWRHLFLLDQLELHPYSSPVPGTKWCNTWTHKVSQCQSETSGQCAGQWILRVPVSQWCDDQSVCAAQVLIAVAELHICDLNDTTVWLLQEVKSWLFLPLKVWRRANVQTHLKETENVHGWLVGSVWGSRLCVSISSYQLLEDVPLVYMDGDQRLVLRSLHFCEPPGCHVN